MQSPEEIATAVVNAFEGDWIYKLSLRPAVATALRAYGAACAQQERERSIKAIQVLIDKDRALGDVTAAMLHTEAQNILID